MGSITRRVDRVCSWIHLTRELFNTEVLVVGGGLSPLVPLNLAVANCTSGVEVVSWVLLVHQGGGGWVEAGFSSTGVGERGWLLVHQGWWWVGWVLSSTGGLVVEVEVVGWLLSSTRVEGYGELASLSSTGMVEWAGFSRPGVVVGWLLSSTGVGGGG
ncbi:hypothetical protein CYMTET_15806 [Cymbomonas tetramitiformis]|uniref:Uncharacterized protein n=1 Tax=Cymbomonas tetramitiformis TaxID=36881 RepID=A0AAE0GDT8_9CHLO|nr:hypothetical protein CYMTET_15806 [Cymbomonas tetramitiformis]